MESRNLSVPLGNVTSIRREVYTGIHLVIFFATVFPSIFLSVMIIMALMKAKEINKEHQQSEMVFNSRTLNHDLGSVHRI